MGFAHEMRAAITKKSNSTYPVPLNGHEIHNRAQLFDTGQQDDQGELAVGDPNSDKPDAALHDPEDGAAGGDGEALADDGDADDGEAVTAVDPGADGLREQDGRGAPDQGVDGHGQQRVGEDGRQEQHGAELEDARVPGREEVRCV